MSRESVGFETQALTSDLIDRFNCTLASLKDKNWDPSVRSRARSAHNKTLRDATDQHRNRSSTHMA